MAEDNQQKKYRAFFGARHPVYTRYLPMWARISSAYKGGDAFKQSYNYLWKYEAETDEDWRERQKRTAYENHPRNIVERFSSILFSRKIVRETVKGNAARWEELNEDYDLRGNSRADWMRRIAFPLSQVYGWLPTYVDSTKKGAKTKTAADDEELGLRAYVVPILPPNLLNWNADRRSMLEWALIKAGTRIEGGPLEQQNKVVEYRLLKRDVTEVWEERVGKGGKTVYTQVDEINHNLGQVPIVVLYDMRLPNEDFVGYPSILDSVDKSIMLFNYSSWSEEAAYKTLYNQLAVPEDSFSGEEEQEYVAGPNYITRYPMESSPPSWVSPPTGPIDALRAEMQDMRRQIYELAGLDAGHAEKSQSELSGVAYTVRRKPTEDKAVRLGQNMQEFEEQLDWMMMGVVEGQQDFESSIIYPRRYAVRDTRDALEQQRIVEESTTIPPKVKARLAAGIVNTNDFAELSDKDLEELEQAILDYNPQAEEVEHTKQLKRAEVDELIPLEMEKIKAQKQYAETIAGNNMERERIRAESAEKIKTMELEQKPAEAPAPKEKPSLWD